MSYTKEWCADLMMAVFDRIEVETPQAPGVGGCKAGCSLFPSLSWNAHMQFDILGSDVPWRARVLVRRCGLAITCF